MTLTEMKIKRMVDNYQYISSVVTTHKYDGEQPTVEERMTQLYHFLRDQMQDVEREDRQQSVEKRRSSNG